MIRSIRFYTLSCFFLVNVISTGVGNEFCGFKIGFTSIRGQLRGFEKQIRKNLSPPLAMLLPHQIKSSIKIQFSNSRIAHYIPNKGAYPGFFLWEGGSSHDFWGIGF